MTQILKMRALNISKHLPTLEVNSEVLEGVQE